MSFAGERPEIAYPRIVPCSLHQGIKARRYEFDPSPIVVRSGEEVRLEVTSEDVTHGIEIQGHDINKKLPPGETVTVRFTAGDPGTYHIHCSKYCGPGHEDMHAELIVARR